MLLTKKIAVSAAALSLLVTLSAFAQTSRIEGVAVGSDGKPLKNAQVRLQSENKKTAATVVKTDAKGHFAATGLSAGTYTVSSLGDGNATVATTRTVARDNQTARVNLAPAVSAKKERWVWVPSGTGSHMGGHYEKVAADGTVHPAPGAQNVDTIGANQLNQLQRPIGGSAAPGGR